MQPRFSTPEIAAPVTASLSQFATPDRRNPREFPTVEFTSPDN